VAGRAFLLVALLLALAGCGGEDETSEEAVAPTTTAGPAQATQTTQAEGGCRQVEQPEAKEDGGQQQPKTRLAAGKTYRIEVTTSCGAFTITLDPESAPRTTASFVALARKGYFDGTVFHRIVPGFVIQGGDPTATGMGGPGYTTVDPPDAGVSYTRGVVAMAKAGNEPNGAAGSQFFVVTAPDAGLPPEYAVIGRVTRGLPVVERIEALGDATTEQPLRPVVVERMRVL